MEVWLINFPGTPADDQLSHARKWPPFSSYSVSLEFSLSPASPSHVSVKSISWFYSYFSCSASYGAIDTLWTSRAEAKLFKEDPEEIHLRTLYLVIIFYIKISTEIIHFFLVDSSGSHWIHFIWLLVLLAIAHFPASLGFELSTPLGSPKIDFYSDCF